MDVTRYVDTLRQELLVAAEARDPQTRELVERLVAPLSSAVRLVLLDALSAAADEITRDLAPGSVELRLRGLDPTFVVTPPPGEQDFELAEDATRPTRSGSPAPPLPAAEDDGALSRINFRPPEQLKARIERAAGQERLSVNAWLVRAVSAILDGEHGSARPDRRAPRHGQRYTGWVS